eukprot:2058-Heterococcus_DN1.PRE.1
MLTSVCGILGPSVGLSVARVTPFLVKAARGSSSSELCSNTSSVSEDHATTYHCRREQHYYMKHTQRDNTHYARPTCTDGGTSDLQITANTVSNRVGSTTASNLRI